MKRTKENKNTQEARARAGGIALFGNLHVLVIAALLAALSIVLGKYLAINLGDSVRVSFENLPVIMAGLFFGPVIGAAVGAIADIVGCFMVGYALNPVITAGAALIGAVSGGIGAYAFRGRAGWRGTWRVFVPVFAAHALGSVCVKTLGMMLYFGTPAAILFVRVPLYIVISILEGYVMLLLFNNKAFTGELNRIINKR